MSDHALKQRFFTAVDFFQRSLGQHIVVTKVVAPKSDAAIHDIFRSKPLFTIKDKPRRRCFPKRSRTEHVPCTDIWVGRGVNSRVLVRISYLTSDSKTSILSPNAFSENSQTVSRRLRPLVSSRVNPIAHMPNITEAIHRLIKISGQLTIIHSFKPFKFPADFLEIIPWRKKDKSLSVRFMSIHCYPLSFSGSVA